MAGSPIYEVPPRRWRTVPGAAYAIGTLFGTLKSKEGLFVCELCASFGKFYSQLSPGIRHCYFLLFFSLFVRYISGGLKVYEPEK